MNIYISTRFDLKVAVLRARCENVKCSYDAVQQPSNPPPSKPFPSDLQKDKSDNS